MYLGVCKAIHLNMIHLDGQKALLWSDLRGTWRGTLRELTDILQGRHPVNMEMHSKGVIEWVSRSTWRPPWQRLADSHGGQDHVNLKALIYRLWRYTWRPCSTEIQDAFGGHYQAKLGKYYEVAKLEPVNGRHKRCRETINRLANVQLWEWDEMTELVSTHQ